jgi:pimeloyl-ACP methyl ester carboxylesterase
VPTVATRAGAVAYAESGAGPALLLLHATLHDRGDYAAVVPTLSEQARVIAVDWPGHGESDPASPHPAGGPWFADVLEDVVDGLGLDDVALVGNSVGGFAVSRFAIRRPERTRAVVLVNASGFTPLNPATLAFCRLMGHPTVNARAVPHLVPWYMRASTDLDRRIVERTVARAHTPEGVAVSAALWHSFSDPAYDLRAQAAQHRAPTLMIWGMRDPVLGPRAGREAKRLLPHAEFVGLDTGHVPFSSDPAGFLAAAVPFLARHRHAPGTAGERNA